MWQTERKSDILYDTIASKQILCISCFCKHQKKEEKPNHIYIV